MKIFIDTEFIEDGHTIDLISIGLVCQDGREYYAISNEFDEKKANNWVKENVIAQLEPKNQGGATFWKPRSQIKDDVVRFIFKDAEGQLQSMTTDSKPEFWGYYADYDWVAFCWLFGSMIALPNGFPMYCRDIKQWCDQLGNPRLPEHGLGEHNALHDARWNKQAWEFLRQYEEDCTVE